MKIDKALLVKGIDGYSDAGQTKKDAYHRAGKKFLRELAKEIGLEKGAFDIRSNVAGIACSGEVDLHGESIYVQLSESCMHPGLSILYRTCKGREDCCGGRNRFVSVNDLTNNDRLESFIIECRRMVAGEA